MSDTHFGEVRHRLHELVNVAGVREPSTDVILLPIDISDAIRNVSTDDVILPNLVESQVGIIHADQNNAGAVGFVDEHFVVELGHGEPPVGSIDVEMDITRLTKGVVQAEDAVGPGVNIERDVPIGREFPRSVLNRFPGKSSLSSAFICKLSFLPI